MKPAIGDPILRGKLAKGMGHNSYGEIAWPNDLLYMFPVCILGVLGLSTSLAYLAPTEVGEISDPFSTPRHLRSYPEWFSESLASLSHGCSTRGLGSNTPG